MVVFPDDFTGPRVLQAIEQNGRVLTTAGFLVQAPAVEPPFSGTGA
jgi:hypothetical protein